MTYWYNDALPIEVHGNWWWQPTGAITHFPVHDQMGVSLHITDVAAYFRNAGNAQSRIHDALNDWMGRTPREIVRASLTPQMEALLARVEYTLASYLTPWLPLNIRQDYLDAINHGDMVKGNLSFAELMARLDAEAPHFVPMLEQVLKKTEFKEFCHQALLTEMRKLYPDIKKAEPPVLRVPAEDDDALYLHEWIDGQALEALALKQWEALRIPADMPLNSDLVAEALNTRLKKARGQYMFEDPAFYGHKLDNYAHDVMKHLDNRQGVECEAICRHAVPVHVLAEEGGERLANLIDQLPAYPFHDRRSRPLGYVNAGGEVYLFTPEVLEKRNLADEYRNRTWLDKFLNRQIPRLFEGVLRLWFKEATQEELTHRMQIGNSIDQPNVDVAGFADCLRSEIRNLKTLPEGIILQHGWRHPQEAFELLKGLEKNLARYERNFRAQLKLGLLMEENIIHLMDMEAFAQFYDFISAHSHRKEVAILMPASTARIHELLDELKEKFPADMLDADLALVASLPSGSLLEHSAGEEDAPNRDGLGF
ncbi:hypothetical protein GC177_09485 [bacterium]|nr:hypothetical protein [bacterium]